MAIETVALIGGAAGIGNIENITIVDDIKAVPPEFTIQISEVGDLVSFFAFKPGTDVTIEASGDTIMQGVVEDFEPAYDGRSHTVRIHGKGIMREWVRSSVQHPTGRFENKTILQIAQALAAPYGIAVTVAGLAADRASEVIKQFQVRKASTPWDELMRLTPQRGMMMHGTRDGKVELIAGTSGSHTGGLIQGQNITRASAKLSDATVAEKFSQLGQSPLTYNKDATQYNGLADGNGKSGSYFQRISSSDTDQNRVQQQAQWWSVQAFGESTNATITTPSWRDDGGQFWKPGQQVFVHSPFLHIDQYLTIMKVEFHQDAHAGTTATLNLQDASSLGGITLGGSNTPFNLTGEGGDQTGGGGSTFGGPR